MGAMTKIPFIDVLTLHLGLPDLTFPPWWRATTQTDD